ncbi:MAG: DUF983 domain-containing protein [Mesorhizobium sp.]|nr:MAG: DUF983 domain-containing protein [Mesorhizobium sp.]
MAQQPRNLTPDPCSIMSDSVYLGAKPLSVMYYTLSLMDKGSDIFARPTLPVALSRGLVGRCPNCGQGKLYRTYLKQVERCAVCGEHFGDIESDDAAPWFTILIAGVFAAPLYFLFQGLLLSYFAVTMVLISLIIVALILLLLPRIKGALISAFWFSRLKNDEPG